MMKRILALVALFVFFTTAAEAQLAAGDVAIVGFWSDTVPSPRRFTFVALTDIAEGTNISFTDKGWLAAGNFRVTGRHHQLHHSCRRLGGRHRRRGPR